MSTEASLLVFAKSPVVGQVKTRLIPDIGPEAAMSLYEELLTRTLNTANNSTIKDIQLWLSGDPNHPFFKTFNELDAIKFKQQTGKDLGEKMFNAFENVLTDCSYAILIGSDCPTLTINDLKSAAEMLEGDKDIVLGPAKDGGYYLIGLRKNNAELFSNIDWGNDSVFSKTTAKVEKLNLNLGLLTVRSDVDRFSDLQAYEIMKKQK
jgi:rSAM/selenodomain-associated transferase 1